MAAVLFEFNIGIHFGISFGFRVVVRNGFKNIKFKLRPIALSIFDS